MAKDSGWKDDSFLPRLRFGIKVNSGCLRRKTQYLYHIYERPALKESVIHFSDPLLDRKALTLLHTIHLNFSAAEESLKVHLGPETSLSLSSMVLLLLPSTLHPGC